MPLEKVYVDCPLCSSTEKRTIYNIGAYGVCRCLKCEMSFLNLRCRQEEIEEYYNRGYFASENELTGGYNNYLEIGSNLTATYRKVYQFIEPFLTARQRVLDIGCGYGYFLEVVKNDFKECFGIEISAEACKILEDKGIRALCGNFETIEISGLKPFDLIVMTDVVEHIYDLGGMMQRLQKLARFG